jgi:hypothetical protein
VNVPGPERRRVAASPSYDDALGAIELAHHEPVKEVLGADVAECAAQYI